MERYFGFDLGDAESAVSVLKKDGSEPKVLKIRDSGSVITAYARLDNQELVIGEGACYHPRAVERRLRFKSRFLTDPESETDLQRFAGGVLGELYLDGNLIHGEDCCFYVGCPAGWSKADRERYRRIFERLGYPPVKIISESRAALVSACQSRYLQVGYDILSNPVLVVDIGSSTTDFAYISKGREVELQTAGEVRLGGGLLDEMLLDMCVAEAPEEQEIRRVFAESDPWRSYCEFAARRLKEKYFSDEAYWQDEPCRQTIRITQGRPLSLTLSMDRYKAERLLDGPSPLLMGRSFHEVFADSLRQTREHLSGEIPSLLFMTGGVSRLKAVSDWCAEVYPESVVITGNEPEYSVSKGLAWTGSIDEEMRAFRQDIENLRDSSVVEKIVAANLEDLYKKAADSLIEPMLREAALPVITRWRDGQIRTLADVDEQMQKEITAWLRSDAAKEYLVKPVTAWLKPVSYALEEHTVPICLKHKVPYRALSLSSYLSVSDIDLKIDAKDVFAVEEATWMLDTVISVIVGLLCGGGGITLIASGFAGIAAGAVLSLLILFIGKNKMQDALLRANIPGPVRKLLPVSYFESRLDKISEEVRDKFYQSLEQDKNDEISDRLVREISAQIESCLVKMAEVVEIPLG